MTRAHIHVLMKSMNLSDIAIPNIPNILLTALEKVML